MVADIGPSEALLKKRADATNYNYRTIAPVVEGAIVYLRTQRCKDPNVLPVLLKYLKERQQSNDIMPDGEGLSKQPPRAPPPTDFFSPIVADLIKDMPDEPELLAKFIAKVEAAMEAGS